MIIKATKKPVTIEAMQFTGDNLSEILDWMDKYGSPGCGIKTELQIHTSEGVMAARVGDYIIKGVQDEFYPCKPDIFKATYNYRCKCGEDISFESVGCIYCKN